MGVQLARVLIAVFGVALILGAVAVAAVAGPAGFFGAAMLFGTGAVLLVGAAIERLRYRSLPADRAGHPTGPGGGEPEDARMETRFQPTPETFLDPTTHRRMRVFVDARTGERRYVAED